jgi:hypothetical protein
VARRLPTASLATLLLALTACRNNTPARIALQSPSLRVFDMAPHQIGATLLSGANKPLLAPALMYSATPPELVKFAADGAVSCRAKGEAVVVVTGGGQNASLTVRCDVIQDLVGPDSLRLVLGRAEEPLAVSALDASAKPISDVPFQITSTDSAVVAVSEGRPIARAVGSAAIMVRAGRALLTVPVTVVDPLNSTAIAAQTAPRSR